MAQLVARGVRDAEVVRSSRITPTRLIVVVLRRRYVRGTRIDRLLL